MGRQVVDDLFLECGGFGCCACASVFRVTSVVGESGNDDYVVFF